EPERARTNRSGLVRGRPWRAPTWRETWEGPPDATDGIPIVDWAGARPNSRGHGLAYGSTRAMTRWNGTRFGLLMQEFRSDPGSAMTRYGYRRIRFNAVLKRPPWEEALYQYGGGDEAMVYFVTDRPDEWLFCSVPYDDTLRELTEGSRYRVSGEIYHF